MGAVRHIRPHGLATGPAGAFSHAPPALHLVLPALRTGERVRRAAASWPWRAIAVSALLHAAAAIVVVMWMPSPQHSAARAAAEVVFWSRPEFSGTTPSRAELVAAPPAEQAAVTAAAEVPAAEPDVVRQINVSPTAAKSLEPTQVAEAMPEAISAETVEPAPARIRIAQAPPPPPAPRPPAVRKAAAPKPSAAETPAPAAVSADPPAAISDAQPSSTQVAGTAVAAAPAASAEPAEPAVVYEPRYRVPPLPPRFPPRALELNQQGTVIVRALVAPDGTSGDIVVWRSSGYALLDAAALRAVRDWAFEPASVGGRRVASWVEVPVRFAIR